MFVAALVVREVSAHSRGMRFRELAVVLAGLGLGGCSGETASYDSGAFRPPREAFWGGQTGSLTPKCGPSVAEPVPEGASGIVVDTRACARPPSDADVELTTESGEAIESEWIPLGDGRFLVRPAQSLAQGKYQVSVAGSSQSVQVGASSPKPARLGTLSLLQPSGCDLSAELTLDDSVLPYVSLLHVEVELDGMAHQVAEYGALTMQNTALPVSCTNCLSSGRHTLQAHGEIAGEPGMLVADALTLDATCSDQQAYPSGGYGRDSGSGCGVTRVPGSGAGGVWGAMALGLLVLLRRSRAKKSGGS
jgi:MYXO-CTERM domain-containing protein